MSLYHRDIEAAHVLEDWENRKVGIHPYIAVINVALFGVTTHMLGARARIAEVAAAADDILQEWQIYFEASTLKYILTQACPNIF